MLIDCDLEAGLRDCLIRTPLTQTNSKVYLDISQISLKLKFSIHKLSSLSLKTLEGTLLRRSVGAYRALEAPFGDR